jgi:hypothetical protein
MTISNQENERLIVENIISDSIGWAKTKDLDRLYAIMAQDDNLFIYHPDSKSTAPALRVSKACPTFG